MAIDSSCVIRSNAKVHIFGFSRGAYTARILNDMLDWVGLLSADNEEMIPFIWKAYFDWKVYRQESSYELLNAYRESVCRGDVSVHFLGLFDTVNSVVNLETVVEEDDPSSRLIRHAVSTDERRVKFQPLLLCRKMATGSGGRKPSKDSASFSAVKYHSNPEYLVQGQDIREVWFIRLHHIAQMPYRHAGNWSLCPYLTNSSRRFRSPG